MISPLPEMQRGRRSGGAKASEQPFYQPDPCFSSRPRCMIYQHQDLVQGEAMLLSASCLHPRDPANAMSICCRMRRRSWGGWRQHSTASSGSSSRACTGCFGSNYYSLARLLTLSSPISWTCHPRLTVVSRAALATSSLQAQRVPMAAILQQMSRTEPCMARLSWQTSSSQLSPESV